MKITYKDRLLDPRWQRKRLEIMERDNFQCQSCGDAKNTLQIHHKSYGRYPWSVKNDQLITLCCECHEFLENYKKNGANVESIRKRLSLDKKTHVYVTRGKSKFPSYENEVVLIIHLKNRIDAGYTSYESLPITEGFADFLKESFKF